MARDENSPCCCSLMTLRTGCLILGWLTIIGSFYNAIKALFILLSGGVKEYAEQVIQQIKAMGVETKWTAEDIASFMTINLWFTLIMGIIVIIIGIYFVKGICNRNPSHMKPFMIYQMIGLVFGAIACLTIIYIPFFILQIWIYRSTKDLKEGYEFSPSAAQYKA